MVFKADQISESHGEILKATMPVLFSRAIASKFLGRGIGCQELPKFTQVILIFSFENQCVGHYFQELGCKGKERKLREENKRDLTVGIIF